MNSRTLLRLGVLVNLTIFPLVDAEQPGDLRHPQNEGQDVAGPVLVNRCTRVDGRKFDCYRTADRKILVQSTTKENEVIKYFEMNEKVFYYTDRDRLKLIDFFLIDDEASALFEVDGVYFLSRSSKNPPKVGNGEIWVGPVVEDCWNLRYHVRMTDRGGLTTSFDFGTEGEQPKIIGARLSALDKVTVTFEKIGEKLIETASYSICAGSDIPTFDEGGGVSLYKNGSLSKVMVIGWNSVQPEDVFAKFYLDGNITAEDIREVVRGYGKDSFVKMISVMKDKEKHAAIMKRVNDAFAEIETKPESQESSSESRGR